MPITKSVEKRVRQSEKRHKQNQNYKSAMRTAVRRVMAAETQEEAEPLYRQAVSKIDKAASKGIIHKNKAAREKSKITRHLNSLSE